MEPDGTLLWASILSNGIANNYKLWRNTIDSGMSLVKYRGTGSVNYMEMLFNVLPTGTPLEVEGSMPVTSRVQNNIN